MLLEKILRQMIDTPGLHLRDAVYGEKGQARLLQEAMGLANASAVGSRYIVFGVVRDASGQLEFTGLGNGALKELQAYPEIIKAYLEPDLKLETFYGDVQGHLLAALEIKDCGNPPYVLKVDASTELGRGECWVREGGLFRPAQRADLDRMYKLNRGSAPAETDNNIVHIGFGNDPARTTASFELPDVANPPSKLAASRMHRKIEAKKQAVNVNMEDTGVARLIHARLYGDEEEFEDQGVNTLVHGYNAVLEDYRAEDDYYYFETNAIRLNLCLVNSGHEALEDVSLLLTFPRAEQFRIAEYIYGPKGSSRSAKESELMGYPRVKYYKSAVQVKQEFDLLEPDELVEVFEQSLRIAAQPELAGKKMRVRYSLQAKGLERPEEGSLKLIFKK